jgi:nicotinamidase-related amidase
MVSALLIIDVQQALCCGDDAAYDIDRVIDRINGLAAQARAAGLPVVLIQHEEADGPLQWDTPGWQLDTRLEVCESDLRVRRRRRILFMALICRACWYHTVLIDWLYVVCKASFVLTGQCVPLWHGVTR